MRRNGATIGRSRVTALVVAIVLVVAVLVEGGGGTGADSAGPIANAFLRQLG
jgi:preprotein translocase subunit SecG